MAGSRKPAVRTRKRPAEPSPLSGASPPPSFRARISISVSPRLGVVLMMSPPRMTCSPMCAGGSARISVRLSERFTVRVRSSGKGELAQPAPKPARATSTTKRRMRRPYCPRGAPAMPRNRCARIRFLMGWRASRYRCLPFLALAVGLVAATPGESMSVVLTDLDREQAIRAGKKSILTEEFGAEWRVKDGAGQTAVVMTPFHRLALAARNSAFQSKELKPRDVDDILKNSEGKLAFWVTLRGGKTDFARYYTPEILVGPQTVKPSFVQNERTALRDGDGRYSAQCVYAFPADTIDPKSRVTLVVRDAEEKEVAKFTVDLAAMR